MSLLVKKHTQQGIVLLEALIGIVIFFIGSLAMIALQARSIATQSDAQYRIEAAQLANRMLSDISLAVRRDTTTNMQADLLAFQHQPIGDTATCSFTGNTSALSRVTAWVTDLSKIGSNTSQQQILVDTNTFNQVTITICWQSPNDTTPHRHTLVSYIN